MPAKKKVAELKKKAAPPVVVKKPAKAKAPKEPEVSQEQQEIEKAQSLLALGVVETTLPDGRVVLQGPSSFIVTGRLVKPMNQDGTRHGKVQTVGKIIWSHLGLTWAEIA